MNRFKEKLSNIKNKIIVTTNNAINLQSSSSSSNVNTSSNNDDQSIQSPTTSAVATTSTHRHNGSSNRKRQHRRQREPTFKFVQVQNTDSLMSIARKYNMTEDDLMIINRLNTKSIYQGQMLMVCLDFTCCKLPTKGITMEQSPQQQQAVDIADLRNQIGSSNTLDYDAIKKNQENLVSQMELTILEKDPLQLIQSYQTSFLPHLREQYDWVVGKNECKSTTEGQIIDNLLHTSLSSLHVSPITDPIIRFTNVMCVTDNLDLMCTGTIHLNRHYLIFSPQQILSNDRIDIEISDITGWKLDSYIDKKIATQTSSDYTTLKLWMKTNPNSKESIISNINRAEIISSTDQDFNWDKDITTFYHLSFLLEKSEINDENEKKLIEILGKPVNLEEDILTFTLPTPTPSVPQNTPMSPLLLNSRPSLPSSYLSPSPSPSFNPLSLESTISTNNNNNSTNDIINTNNTTPTTSTIDQLTTTMVAQVLPSSKINENELIKEKVNCVFEYGKVTGILTLMPHWLIFQADPNHPLVRKLGSIKFQLNYTMNQVVSCGMVPKTFLSPSIDGGDLQFGMDEETPTSPITSSTGIMGNPSSPTATTSSSSNISSTTSQQQQQDSSQSLSSVHVVLQITSTVEKDILIECEDEKSQYLCNQIRQWMGDMKEKMGSTLATSPSQSTIIDNLSSSNPISPPPRTLTKESSKSNLYQSVLTLSTSMVDRYLERVSSSSTYDIEGEIPMSDPQVDNFMPELLDGKTTMLSTNDIKQLIVDLPIFYKLRNWTLLYKCEKHGISINTMYSRCREKGGCLLVIQDFNKNIFGGFLSESIKPSKNYYGSGECFLFKLKPYYSSYHWTKENECFIQTTEKYLSMGGGNKGKYGLWLDDNFEQGSSHRCETYDNDPLSTKEDFLCMDIEIWGFV